MKVDYVTTVTTVELRCWIILLPCCLCKRILQKRKLEIDLC